MLRLAASHVIGRHRNSVIRPDRDSADVIDRATPDEYA
jgi:hypothetical protein